MSVLYLTENFNYGVRYEPLNGTYDVVEVDRFIHDNHWKAVANRDWPSQAREFADNLELERSKP